MDTFSIAAWVSLAAAWVVMVAQHISRGGETKRLREDIKRLEEAIKLDSELHSERHWSLYEAHHRSRRDVEALAALHGFEFRENPHRLAVRGVRP